MSAKPMFFFAGVYPDPASAEADYQAVRQLHADKEIGSYDAAVIVRERGGRIKVSKREKPTQHGGWIGLAAGAAAAIVFPALLPGVVVSGAAGAGMGAWIGHLAHGMSRADAREIGEMLDRGDAALIVVGVDRDAERVRRSATKAREHALKRLERADSVEAEQEAIAEMSRAA